MLQHLDCTPSAPTLQRNELALDVAMMLVKQDEFSQREAGEAPNTFRYGWADSSPQGHHDWLWMQHHAVAVDDLVPTWRAVCELVPLVQCEAARHDAMLQQHREADGDVEIEFVAPLDSRVKEERPSWVPYLKQIAAGIQEHIHPPVDLTSGYSGVAHKASAIAWALSLEVPSLAHLRQYSKSFLSFTTDLGTESGLTEFRGRVGDVLPAWRFSGGFEADVEMGAASTAGKDDEEYFLPNAFPIAGMQHVTSNLCKDMDSALDFWTAFHASLKNLEDFLCSKPRRDAFIFTCLKGGPGEVYQQRFMNWTATLYEKRWHEVTLFLKALRPLLLPLRKSWDQHKWQNARGRIADPEKDSKPANKFDAKTLTNTLHDPFFAACVHLVVKVGSVPQEIASWAEGCICHEPLCIRLSAHRQRNMLRDHYDSSMATCPMRGKRAAELAAGEHLSIAYDRIWTFALDELTTMLEDVPLMSAHWGRLYMNMQSAKAHMRGLLQLKTEYAQRLPVSLCILSHHDEEVARSGASKLLKEFQAAPLQDLHHRVTWAWLSDPHFISDLEKFIGGSSRLSLSSVSQRRIAQLRFVAIAETTIEEKHSRLALQLKKHGIGPARTSLTNRQPLLERWICRFPEQLPQICKRFEGARKYRNMASLMQLDGHPALDGVAQKRDELLPRLTSIIYRCDIDSLFYSLNKQARRHKKLKESHDKAAVKKLLGAGKVPKPTFDSVMQEAIREHFRSQAAAAPKSTIYSIPASSAVEIQGLGSFFGATVSVGEVANEYESMEMVADTHSDGAPDSRLSRLFFKPIILKPFDKKSLRVAHGAGRRLKTQHIAISLLECLRARIDLDDPSGELINAAPIGEQSLFDPVMLLGDLGSVAMVEEEFFTYQLRTEQVWGFPPNTLVFPLRGAGASATWEGTCEVATSMVAAAAFPESMDVYSFVNESQDFHSASVLAQSGFVEFRGSYDDKTVCRFTKLGLRKLIYLLHLGTHSKVLCRSSSCCCRCCCCCCYCCCCRCRCCRCCCRCCCCCCCRCCCCCCCCC